jgi:hypothetical protein
LPPIYFFMVYNGGSVKLFFVFMNKVYFWMK